MPRLARSLFTRIGSSRIYSIFKIKAGSFRKRYRSRNRCPKEKSPTITNILKNIASNMQVESSASPLLTEDKASSLPGQFCTFHSRSTLELIEKAQGFCYVYYPEKMCLMFAPASEWKEDVEWIAHHTHPDVKKNMQLSWSAIVLTS